MLFVPLTTASSIIAAFTATGVRHLDAHRHYFARQASREGFELNDDILTLFERFSLGWRAMGIERCQKPQAPINREANGDPTEIGDKGERNRIRARFGADSQASASPVKRSMLKRSSKTDF